jgi:hypothetical protein
MASPVLLAAPPCGDIVMEAGADTQTKIAFKKPTVCRPCSGSRE